MAALLLVGAAPLLLAQPVPLQDWPNHVAGAHVLAALLDGDPFWTRFYRFNTFLVPNAAVDLGLLGLRAAGCSEAVAANLFLLATYGVFMAGMALLSRTLARLDAGRIAAAVLLFYSTALFWGLANYVLAVGMMWVILAVWLGARRRVALAASGSAVLLFVHAVPAVVLPLLLLCFDAARVRGGARLRSCGSAPAALATVAILLRLLPGRTGDGLLGTYTGAGSVRAFALWKLRVLGTALFGGSLLQDGATAVALVGVIGSVALATRRRMPAGAALGVAALVLLTLAAPERLGGGSLLDVRLAVLPPMLLAASLRLEWRGRRTGLACAALVASLVVARTAVIAVEWRRAAAVFAAFEAQTASLPPGSLMMMAYGRRLEGLSWTDIWSPPIQSIATQVVRRGVFFPALFANPDQQTIELRPEFRALGQPWNLSDSAHRQASRPALDALCASGGYRGVFLTVLYSGPAFRILDACDQRDVRPAW